MRPQEITVAKALKTIPDLMQELEWKTSCGCAKCRPALNYYLLATWPGEYQDDSQSRFINERVHANIQKDGTFSVVPQMRGGVTTPEQLRRIADVAEKYAVPMVKLTGGQRIDLLGIRKEDLPHVWADLGMPSGFAYGKSFRTVKTCVGQEFCRFGLGDSTKLGVDLETRMQGMESPAKMKLSVSGCPRNCAETTIRPKRRASVGTSTARHAASGVTRSKATSTSAPSKARLRAPAPRIVPQRGVGQHPQFPPPPMPGRAPGAEGVVRSPGSGSRAGPSALWSTDPCPGRRPFGPCPVADA